MWKMLLFQDLWARESKEFKDYLKKNDFREYMTMRAMADLDMECPKLERLPDGTTKCTEYSARPNICKAYPPSIEAKIPGCGYSFTERKENK